MWKTELAPIRKPACLEVSIPEVGVALPMLPCLMRMASLFKFLLTSFHAQVTAQWCNLTDCDVAIAYKSFISPLTDVSFRLPQKG